MRFRHLNQHLTCTHRFSTEFTISSCPPIARNLPRRLRHKCRECEPVVIFILLEVGVGDKKELVEARRIFLGDDTFPYLMS